MCACVCGERERRIGGEDEEECKEEGKMNVSCIRCTVYWRSVWIIKLYLRFIFVDLLKFEALARTVSVESTLALNPRCFGAKAVYLHTSHTHPPHCTAIHDSPSVLPRLEKSQGTRSNTLGMAKYCSNFTACTPLTQVRYVPKSLPRALRNIRHMPEWSTSSEGACSKSLWNKVLKEILQETHIQDQSLLNFQCCTVQWPGLVLCPSCIPEEVCVIQMSCAHNKRMERVQLTDNHTSDTGIPRRTRSLRTLSTSSESPTFT